MILFQKWYLISFPDLFAFMDLWNHSWDPCESPTMKMSHRLCSLIVIYTKQSLPCFPPVFVGWGRMDDHCFVGTFLGAPLSLYHLCSSSSLSQVSVPLCPPESRSSIPLAQKHSETTEYLGWTAKLLWLLIPGGHPVSFALAPDTLVWTFASSSPTPEYPCSYDSIPLKLCKSLKDLE